MTVTDMDSPSKVSNDDELDVKDLSLYSTSLAVTRFARINQYTNDIPDLSNHERHLEFKTVLCNIQMSKELVT